MKLNLIKNCLTSPYGLVYNQSKIISRSAKSSFIWHQLRRAAKKREKGNLIIPQKVKIGGGIDDRIHSKGIRRGDPGAAEGARADQAALAEFTGFSVSFLSDLENGKQTAELGKALYLANLLGLDAELRKRGDAG